MSNSSKVAGIAGILWAVTNSVLGFGTGQPPELDSSGREIADYLADGRSVYLAAVAAFGATLPLLFVFVGGLVRRTRDHEGALRGGAATVLIQPALATMVIGTALAYLALLPFIYGDGLGSDASDGLLRYAYVFTFVASMIGNIGGAVLIAAASTAQSASARTASLVVAGVVGVSGVGGLVNPDVALLGGLGLMAIAIWTVVVSIGMLRAAERSEVSPTATAATA